MIETQLQLLGSLEYAAKWANVLKGLRLSAAEAGTDVNLLTTSLGGPLSEVRHVLVEACEFLETQGQDKSPDYHLSVRGDQDKAA